MLSLCNGDPPRLRLLGIVNDIIAGDTNEQAQAILRFAVAWPLALTQALIEVRRLRARNMKAHKVLAKRVRRRVRLGIVSHARGEYVIKRSREFYLSVLKQRCKGLNKGQCK